MVVYHFICFLLKDYQIREYLLEIVKREKGEA